MVAPALIVMPKRMYYGTVEEGYLHTRLINSTVVAERNESHDQNSLLRALAAFRPSRIDVEFAPTEAALGGPKLKSASYGPIRTATPVPLLCISVRHL